ncbi:transforming growth factor beta receptor type 3 [Danio aesculapii]|uniref:transforming growth factor beta receptor type 3 n=1 Tax=Danio aesculapii TaxID=1142201 RepID=UPI0024BF6851|nr:transforming growth factor beta receptor type 3 [Danio aesculapii]
MSDLEFVNMCVMKMLAALICLPLTVLGIAVSSKELQCSVSPVAVLHPVQAQLERFEAGTGCASREGGAKETHVISMGGASIRQVTIVLRPLNPSRPIKRPVILVLSSQQAVRWVLENEGLSSNINVLVQLSVNSTAESSSLSVRVTQVPSLPRRPRVLLRWVLQRHATVTSLTHTTHANRVYLRLGEDPSMPSECRLRSLFVSQNYQASELQEQEVHGCTPTDESTEMEVHIIRLWSSGSGLCGSLQVEVSVSLLPPVASSALHRVVLILSSATAVNWALVAPQVKGHVRVYSSHSVSLPYRSQASDLIMTSTVTSDLLNTPDLLEWANQNGFPKVTSYTEADLANRFVVKLGEGTDSDDASSVWHHQDDIMIDSPDALSYQCEGGALTVTVDTQMLKTQVWPVTAVTLRDPECKAEFNGSHFLLVSPVISCGTEGEMDEASGRVHYTNTVLLWKQKPSEGLTNQTRPELWDESRPLAIHLSCVWSLSAPVSPSVVSPSLSAAPDLALSSPQAPAPPALWGPRADTTAASPLLSMELFVSEAFQQRTVGPCVISAHERVYVQISVDSSSALEAVELQSCLVSPLSDPQAHSGWPVIKDSCPSESSFSLTLRENTDDGRADDEDEELNRRKSHPFSRWRHTESRSADDTARGFKHNADDTARRFKHKRPRARKAERRRRNYDEDRSLNALRFSFVLRPVFNNSIQFLHCRLRVCDADEGPAGAAKHTCADGRPIPALTHIRASQKCKDRNLSRPVLVTYPAGFLAPPAGKLAQTPAEMSEQAPSPTGAVEGSVLLVVFAAFLMGLSLMGALWCIYTHTGRHDLTQRISVIETTVPNPGFINPPILMEETSSFHDVNDTRNF